MAKYGWKYDVIVSFVEVKLSILFFTYNKKIDLFGLNYRFINRKKISE